MNLPEKDEPDRDREAGDNRRAAPAVAARSRDAFGARPMKIAISPIGSIATNSGMNATSKFLGELTHGKRRQECLYRSALLHNVPAPINHP